MYLTSRPSVTQAAYHTRALFRGGFPLVCTGCSETLRQAAKLINVKHFLAIKEIEHYGEG